MHPALEIARSGLDAQQMNMSNAAHNLANVSTTGFKGAFAKFKDLSYQNVRQPGSTVAGDARLPSGLVIGTGVELASVEKNFKVGDRKQTDSDFHLMIDGDGFFQIQNADGTRSYTRDGSFSLDSNGNMVTSEGSHLVPNIIVPANAQKVMISSTGIVSVILPGSAAAQQLGTLELATFINKGGLQAVGDNLYIETDASGKPGLNAPGTESGMVVQRALESSNVNVVEELVKMIEIQRAYETNANVLKKVDESLQGIIQVLR
jgi:flagellar basal-body rod protein FlgG